MLPIYFPQNVCFLRRKCNFIILCALNWFENKSHDWISCFDKILQDNCAIWKNGWMNFMNLGTELYFSHLLEIKKLKMPLKNPIFFSKIKVVLKIVIQRKQYLSSVECDNGCYKIYIPPIQAWDARVIQCISA